MCLHLGEHLVEVGGTIVLDQHLCRFLGLRLPQQADDLDSFARRQLDPGLKGRAGIEPRAGLST